MKQQSMLYIGNDNGPIQIEVADQKSEVSNELHIS